MAQVAIGGIKMIPFVGSLPVATLTIWEINNMFKKTRKKYTKKLKKQNKELKKLKQSWLRRKLSRQ